MEKQIKDYAHFYIGQPCVNSWVPVHHDLHHKEWILEAINTQDPRRYRIGNGDDYIWVADIKPLLRRLDSLTDEERRECDRQCHKYETGCAPSHFITDWAYRITWLVGKGIDVFGLIPAGLAIDKTQQQHKEGGV